MCRGFLFAFCLILSLAPHKAAAADFTAEGAAQLQRQVAESLAWRARMAQVAERGFVVEKPPEVSAKGSFYEVRLSDAVFSFGPKGQLEIGTVILNAVPGTQGQWVMTVALPKAMLFRGPDGDARISFNKQMLSGVWWPELELYTQLNAQYDGIKIENLAPAGSTVEMETAKAAIRLSPEADGTWSGPTGMQITGITLSSPAARAMSGTVKSLQMENVYTRFDAKNLAKLKKDFLQATNETAGKAVLAEAIQHGPAALDGLQTALQVSGVSFRQKGLSPDGHRPLKISLNKYFLLSNSKGMRGNDSSVSFKQEMDGLKVDGVPEDYAGLVPHSLTVELEGAHLPAQKMNTQIAGALQTALLGGKQDESAAMDALMGGLPELLQSSDATLTVKNTRVKSDDMNISVAGKLSTTLGMKGPAVGNIAMTVKGLAATVKRLQKRALLSAGKDPSLMGIAGALTAVEALGEGTGETRTYIFKFTPEGQLLLNDIDMKQLLLAPAEGDAGKP